MRTTLIAALLIIASACGLDPEKIPSTRLYADDGASVAAPAYLNFAVIGASRTPVMTGEPEATKQLVDDLRREVPVRDLSFGLFTGGMVARSTTGEWSSFAERWSPVFRGEVVSDNQSRIAAIPMPGRNEAAGDKALKGMGAAFENAGADIGYGRVASWSRFDADVGGAKWRILLLDTNKKALGSRWDEQMFWLPGQVSGDSYDHLVVFMTAPRFTTADGHEMSAESNAGELLEVVDAHSDLMKLKAVFSGGPATNEVYLPTGSYGELFVVAGNGSISGDSFMRGASAEAAGLDDNLALEPAFMRVLTSEFARAGRGLEFNDKVRETFEGTEGNPPQIPGGDFPVQGWWTVHLNPKGMSATWRIRRYDGEFNDAYRVTWTRGNGWVAKGL